MVVMGSALVGLGRPWWLPLILVYLHHAAHLDVELGDGAALAPRAHILDDGPLFKR